MCPPRWGLVVFRLVGPDNVEKLNRAFQQVLLAHSRDMFLTPTVLPEVGYCFRLALGSPHVQAHHVDRTVRLLHEYAEHVRI